MRTKHRFVYLVNLAQRRMDHWMRAKNGEITAAQSGVLFFLARPDGDGARTGDLARAVGLRLPGASGLLDRMEAAQLVERRPDAEDGRASRVHLTARGRAAQTEALEAVSQINARLTSGFTSDELDVVARWLTHVATTFSPEGAP